MNKQYMKTIIKKILFFVQEKSLKLTELNAILAEIEQFHLGYFFKHKISCCRLSDDSEATSMDDTSAAIAAANKSLQSCPTLCNPIDGSPPGSLVPGILQARTLEWVAISFSSSNIIFLWI